MQKSTQHLPPAAVARVKATSTPVVLKALRRGILNHHADTGMIAWDSDYEAWCPRPSEETVYAINEGRAWTRTIRIKPKKALVAECIRTAKAHGPDTRWDMVPLNEENADMLLSLQRGSLDGNIDNKWLRNEVDEALQAGVPVYQKRIYTTMDDYNQALHPCPRVVMAEDLLDEPRVTERKLMNAVDNISTFICRSRLFILLDEAYRAWVQGLQGRQSTMLFSKRMMEA